MKNFTLFIYYILTVGLAFSVKAQQKNTRLKVTGFVRNAMDNRPLKGATLLIQETGYGTTTDSLGYFELMVPRGIYFVNISYSGFFFKKEKLVVPDMKTLDVLLYEKVNDLNEVTVTGQTGDQNVKRVETGVTTLNSRTLKKIPVLMGEVDVIKSLFTLPGVATVGEGATGFNVRGGAIDQNLVLMDDAPIFNASHLMGFFSIFNPDALQNLNFYRGGIPARYGGRTASVLDIRLKEAKADKLQINGGIGLVAGRLMVEAPIIKEKLSVYLGTRASYLSYLFKILPAKYEGIRNTEANFNDLTFKTDYKLSNKDKISFTGFTGTDNFKIAGDSLSSLEVNSTSSKFNWRTSTGTLSWAHAVNERFNFKISGIYSRYDANISNADSANAYKLSSSIDYRSAKADFFYQIGQKQKVDFGASYIVYAIEPNNFVPGQYSQLNKLILPKEQASETGVYINDEITLGKYISLGIGARWANYVQYGPATVFQYETGIPRSVASIIDSTVYSKGSHIQTYGGLEPRMALNLGLNEFNSIKMSYNRVRQFVQMISNTTAALPTTRWKVADPYIKPQLVDQVSIGYYKNDKEKIYESSFEVFYKKIENSVEYMDGSNPLFEQYPETKLLQGNGFAYGAELYVKKNLGVFTGWLSYTYSQARIKVAGPTPETTINLGEYFPPNYNKPHVLNILGNYQLNEHQAISVNFTYSTGRPVTYPDYQFRIGTITAPYFTRRNQGKIPDYVRLDLSYNVDPKPNHQGRWKGSWNFSIYNLLNTRNAYSVFFKTRNFASRFTRGVDIYKFSVLGSVIPSVTYNFKF